MKKLFTITALLLTSMTCIGQTMCPKFANIWAHAQVYPAGTGEVRITSNDYNPVLDGKWGEESETKFTTLCNGLMTNYYNVVDGEFVIWANFHFFAIVQVKPAEGYECVGIVNRLKEDWAYEKTDYFFGDRAVFDKSFTYLNNTKEVYGCLYDQPLEYVYEDGTYVDMNSQRSKEDRIMPDTLMDDNAYYEMSLLGEEEKYTTLHDMNIEKGHWDDQPIEIYAIFKEKERITMNETGQMLFSSSDNLRIQPNSDLEAYVVKEVVDGKATLKEINRIPANLGVLLKGEPGKEYVFDRIAKPKYVTIISANGAKTYNLLLCEIFGFYPEDEILYRFGNYDYGAGFYKVQAGPQPENTYLTMAIPGGKAPEFFTIDGFTTGIDKLANSDSSDSAPVFDLQGRRLKDADQKGMYIVNGKKVVVR